MVLIDPAPHPGARSHHDRRPSHYWNPVHGGVLCFAPISDSAAKLIANSTPMVVLLLARYLSQWLFTLPVVILTDRHITTSWTVMRIIILRSLVHILGVAAMFGDRLSERRFRAIFKWLVTMAGLRLLINGSSGLLGL